LLRDRTEKPYAVARARRPCGLIFTPRFPTGLKEPCQRCCNAALKPLYVTLTPRSHVFGRPTTDRMCWSCRPVQVCTPSEGRKHFCALIPATIREDPRLGCVLDRRSRRSRRHALRVIKAEMKDGLNVERRFALRIRTLVPLTCASRRGTLATVKVNLRNHTRG